MMAGDSPAPFEEAPEGNADLDAGPEPVYGGPTTTKAWEIIRDKKTQQAIDKMCGLPPIDQPDAPKDRTFTLDMLSEAEKSKLQLIVRGGTTTSAFDNEMAQKMADAEVRREEDEKVKKIGQIPIEQGGGVMYEANFSDPTASPKVLIKYVGKGKEVRMEQLCELVFDDTSGDHMFIFVCPECFNRGIPSGFAQCHVRASHRAWHLDTKTAGEVKAVKNSDNPRGIEYYQHAGDIMDSEILRCDGPNCGCAFKIHRNIMYRV